MREKFVWEADAMPPKDDLIETEYLVHADLVLNYPDLSHSSKLDYHEIKLRNTLITPRVIVTGKDDADIFHLRYVYEG